jgi:hypothetical protein
MVTKGLIRTPMHRELSAAQPIGNCHCFAMDGRWVNASRVAVHGR